MLDNPLVSVIIPTCNRPQLVCRAIRTALDQTLREIEVVVVIDGPDPATDMAVRGLSDSRIRIMQHPSRKGPAAARNSGIRAATAPWVALLDDDDEWLPEKLERQIAMAMRTEVAFPILGTRAYVKTPIATYIWPTRRPRVGEHLSEYLFVRTSLFAGEGWYTTPSLMAKTELARRVPFDETLYSIEDNDWLLRVASQDGAQYDLVWEPLCIYYWEQERPTVSGTLADWKPSLEWASRQRHLFTASAYAGFCLKASHRAAAAGEWSGFFIALWMAVRHGRPTLLDLMIFLAIWTIPRKMRRQLRAAYYRRNANASGNAPSG